MSTHIGVQKNVTELDILIGYKNGTNLICKVK